MIQVMYPMQFFKQMIQWKPLAIEVWNATYQYTKSHPSMKWKTFYRLTYSSSFLKKLKHSTTSPLFDCHLRFHLSNLGILRKVRGSRSGRKVKKRLLEQKLNIQTYAQSTTSSSVKSQELISQRTSNPTNPCTIDCYSSGKEINPPQESFLTNSVRISQRHSKHKLKVAHLNIQSLKERSHLIQVKNLVDENKFDILTFSETWLNSTVTNTEMELNGYKLFRLDRLHKNGGGVCVYLKNHLQATKLPELSEISSSGFHQLWLQVQNKKHKSVIICTTYRPPDCPLSCFSNDLAPKYIDALTLDKPIIILGDLNCDLLSEGPERKALIDFNTELNLTQVIKEPTRVTKTSSTLIDVILLSSTDIVKESGVLKLNISDHFLVYSVLNLKVLKPPPSYITTRSYKNYNPIHFANAMSVINLTDNVQETDVNKKLETFNNLLQTTLDKYAPVKTVKIKQRPLAFINKEVKDLMKTRDTLHRKFYCTRDPSDWFTYVDARNNAKSELRNAEKDHVKLEINKNRNNIGSLWKTIRQCLPAKLSTKPVYRKDLKTITNEFNEYFTSVGRKAAIASRELAVTNNIILTDIYTSSITQETQICHESFHFKQVSINQIRAIVVSLPSNKAPGPDLIPMRIIKDCLHHILPTLTDIINCSLTTSTYPDIWKIANVIPLPKEGNHEEACNNRPLSLLPVISKICEKVVLIQLTEYLQKHNLLNCHQSGNKKNHSTETLNILITDMILSAMNQKQVTALILLDLSKAFDSINHVTLLYKLEKMGISSSAIKWFKSYLTNRKQAVRIEHTVSDTLQLNHGVPQGSILSPLLFSIYLNDLPSSTQHCQLESYVDDSKVFLSFSVKNFKEIAAKLKSDLTKITKWCCENSLLINPVKTKLLLLSTRQLAKQIPQNFSVEFLTNKLYPVTEAKDLGVLMDKHLTYDSHISKLTSSCIAKLLQITRVKYLFDTKTLQTIINTLVFSKLFYCSSVWGNTTDKNLKKLQLIENFAARIISNTGKFDHISPIIRQLNWLTVKDHIIFRDILMIFKILKGEAPEYLTSKFRKRNEVHAKQTRQSQDLDVPYMRSATGQRSFVVRVAKLWNNLDNELKSIKNLKTFKTKLKEHLFSKSECV